MKGAQHSAKNTAKNISLIVLVVMLGVLCAANWLAGMNIAQMPADNLLRRAYDHLFGGAVGYELRSSGVSAAEPAQLALTVDGQLYGVQYNMTDIDAGLAAVRPVWTQALSDGTLSESSEQELLSALSAGDCAVLRYHGAIPLSVVAGWMGGSWKDDGERTVETLVYAAGAERLFARASDGALYSAPARVDSSTMASAQQAFRGLPCKFSGDAYAVYPETLLFEGETLTLPLLEERAIDLFAAQSGAGRTACGVRVYGLYGLLQRDQRAGARVCGQRQHAACERLRPAAIRLGRDGQHGARL